MNYIHLSVFIDNDGLNNNSRLETCRTWASHPFHSFGGSAAQDLSMARFAEDFLAFYLQILTSSLWRNTFLSILIFCSFICRKLVGWILNLCFLIFYFPKVFWVFKNILFFYLQKVSWLNVEPSFSEILIIDKAIAEELAK